MQQVAGGCFAVVGGDIPCCLQEIQDRQRIQQLLDLSQPLQQTITYSQGAAPSSVTTAFPGGSGGSKGLGPVHLISLEALLAVLQALSERLDAPPPQLLPATALEQYVDVWGPICRGQNPPLAAAQQQGMLLQGGGGGGEPMAE